MMGNQSTLSMKKVAQIFVPREQGGDPGPKIKSFIGGSKLPDFDPFLMFVNFNVKLPGGFPDHPHRGM